MNIIFLDLDGPAFPDAIIQCHPNQDLPYPGTDPALQDSITYWAMCERFKYMWTHLTNTRDFQVVISSTWRKHYPTPNSFHDLFEQNGLVLNLHSDWATKSLAQNTYGAYSSGYSSTKCTRAEEIHLWIMDHPELSEFIILDDPESGSSLIPESVEWNVDHTYMANYIVLVSSDMGFGATHIQQVKNLTDHWRL